jgi:glycosyltransferase
MKRGILGIIDVEDQFSTCALVASRLIIDGDPELRPRLSIMIPTFRRPGFLGESISSALAQVTDTSYEIVVVDNDHTMAAEVDTVVRDFCDPRLRLFRNAENIGMFGNWNRCIELARGEWVSILSDDDLLHQDFIRTMRAAMERNSGINLLFCRSELLDSRGSLLSRLKSKAKQKLKTLNACLLSGAVVELRSQDVYFDSPCGSLGMVFKRSHAIALGGYKAAAFPSSDYVFFSMYHLRFGSSRLNKCLAYYRIHENETANPTTGEGFIAINLELRKALERYVAAPKPLLRLYTQLCALNLVRRYKQFWGADLDIERIRQKYQLTSCPDLAIYIVRIILRVCLACTGLFKGAQSAPPGGGN